MRIHRILIPLTLFAAATLAQQADATAAERVNTSKPAIDPAALQALRTVTDTLKNAQTFTFKAVIEREIPDANGQILTFVRHNDVAVKRPGRLRIDITGEKDKVQVYFNNGELFVYAPAAKEYVGLGTSSLDLDTAVDRLEMGEIVLPMAPLFRSDPYRNLIEGLQGATVLGPVDIEGKTYQHLAFAKPDVDWQLWIGMDAKPLPRRAQAVYKTQAHEPGMTIDFSDWNLSPDLPADYFAFQRPPDAKAVPGINIDQVK